MLEIDSGDEKTIELEQGNYLIGIKGFSMRTATIQISINEQENKVVYIYFDFLSKGKFHEQTSGMFLLKAPLGLSEELPNSIQDNKNICSLPIFQSVTWAVLVGIIGIVPVIVEIFTSQNTLNIVLLLTMALIPILSVITFPNYIQSKRFYNSELYLSALLLLFLFFFHENIQQLTGISVLSSAVSLMLVFVLKYFINKKSVCKNQKDE